MLSTAELNSMRTTAGAALPDTCVIQTQGWASDGGGGGTLSWTAAGTVDCRLAPISGSEGEVGERITADAEFVFTLPHDAAVSTGSRIVHAAGTFDVAAVHTRSWQLTKRVETKREA